MNEIKVDANDVVDALAQEIARIHKDMAILTAKLKSAQSIIDGYGGRELPK